MLQVTKIILLLLLMFQVTKTSDMQKTHRCTCHVGFDENCKWAIDQVVNAYGKFEGWYSGE